MSKIYNFLENTRERDTSQNWGNESLNGTTLRFALHQLLPYIQNHNITPIQWKPRSTFLSNWSLQELDFEFWLDEISKRIAALALTESIGQPATRAPRATAHHKEQMEALTLVLDHAAAPEPPPSVRRETRPLSGIMPPSGISKGGRWRTLPWHSLWSGDRLASMTETIASRTSLSNEKQEPPQRGFQVIWGAFRVEMRRFGSSADSWAWMGIFKIIEHYVSGVSRLINASVLTGSRKPLRDKKRENKRMTLL